jgi:hypothetical protein
MSFLVFLPVQNAFELTYFLWAWVMACRSPLLTVFVFDHRRIFMINFPASAVWVREGILFESRYSPHIRQSYFRVSHVEAPRHILLHQPQRPTHHPEYDAEVEKLDCNVMNLEFVLICWKNDQMEVSNSQRGSPSPVQLCHTSTLCPCYTGITRFSHFFPNFMLG